MQYQEEKHSDVCKLINEGLALFVTATDLETKILHQKMVGLSPFDKIVKVHKGNLTIFLGTFGKYRVAHVQCAMGAMSRSSSILTVAEALEVLKPKLVVMPGIAFGVDEKSQNIGDVLIAEVIYPYNFKRVGAETLQRGIPLVASKMLVNRFKSIIPHWEFLLQNRTKSKLLPCHLLSGEELIDDINYRNSLLQEFKSAKGGEMEGAGIYAACSEKCPCILIKGICDFADGNKSNNKEENQELAMHASLSACMEVFSSKSTFTELGLQPQLTEAIKPPINHNSLLFDVYSLEKEPYYVKRKEDDEFNDEIKLTSSWYFGVSGCGKSNLVLRNLAFTGTEFIYISLASCVQNDINEFFCEIYQDLAIKTSDAQKVKLDNFSAISRELVSLLARHFSNKQTVIFIEEIPLESGPLFKEFVEKCFALLIKKSEIQSLQSLRFIFCSIEKPTKHIQSFHQKIHEQLKFKELKNWADDDIEKLILLLTSEMNLTLSSKTIKHLAESCAGSPRFIKKYFRNVITQKQINNDLLFDLVGATKIELSQI